MSGKIGQNELRNLNSGLTVEDYRKVYSEDPKNINKGYIRLVRKSGGTIGLEKINNKIGWAPHWMNLSKAHNQALRNDLVRAMQGGIAFCDDFIRDLTNEFVSSAGTGSAGKVARLEIKELFRKYDEKFNTAEGRREICAKMVDAMMASLEINDEMRLAEYRVQFQEELTSFLDDRWFAMDEQGGAGGKPKMAMREAEFRAALGEFASRLASVKSKIQACESLHGALTGLSKLGGLKIVDLAAKVISGEITDVQQKDLIGGMNRELVGLRRWLGEVGAQQGLKGFSTYCGKGVESDFIYLLSRSFNPANLRVKDLNTALDGFVERMRKFSDAVQNPDFSVAEQVKMDKHVKATVENLEGNLESTGASESSGENMKNYVRASEDVHVQRSAEENAIGNYVDGLRHGKGSVYLVETGEIVDEVTAKIDLDASKLERKAKFVWGPKDQGRGLDKLVDELTGFIESMTEGIEAKVNERTFPKEVKDYLLKGLKDGVLPNLLGDVLREIEENPSAKVPDHMFLKDNAKKALTRIVDDFVKLTGALRLVSTATGEKDLGFLAVSNGMKVFNDQIKQIQKANVGKAQKADLISMAQKGLSKVLSATLSAYLASAHEGKSILKDVAKDFGKALKDATADFDERMDDLNDQVAYSLIELSLAGRPKLLERCRSLPMLWFVDDRLESGEDDEGGAIAKLQPSIWRASVVEVINGYKGEINPDDDAVMDKINDAYSKRMKKTVDKYVKFRTSVSNGFAAALRKELDVILKDNPAVKGLSGGAVKDLAARLSEHVREQNAGRLVDVLAEEFLVGDKKANVNHAVAQLVSGKGESAAAQLKGLLAEWQMAGEKYLQTVTGQEVNYWGHKVEHHDLTNAVHAVADDVALKLDDKKYGQDVPDVSKFNCERQNVARAMVNRIIADLRANPATFGGKPFCTFFDRYHDVNRIVAEAKSYQSFRKQAFEKLSEEDRKFVLAEGNEKLRSHILDFAVSEAYVEHAAPGATKEAQSAALTAAVEKAKRMIADRRIELEAIAKARREELIAKGRELVAEFRDDLFAAIEESVPGEGSRALYEPTVRVMREAAARLCDKDMIAALEKDPEKFVSEFRSRPAASADELRKKVFGGLKDIHMFCEKTWENELPKANPQYAVGPGTLQRHVEWLMANDQGFLSIREIAERSFIGSLPAFTLGSEASGPAVTAQQAIEALKTSVVQLAKAGVTQLLRDEYDNHQLKISRQAVESLIEKNGIKDAPEFQPVRDRVWQMFEERRKLYEAELRTQTSDNTVKFSDGPLLLGTKFIVNVQTEIRKGVMDAVFGPLEESVPEETRAQHCEGVDYLGHASLHLHASLNQVVSDSNAKVDETIKNVLSDIRAKYASKDPLEVIAAAKPTAGGSVLRQEIARQMEEALAPVKREAEFRYHSERNYLECLDAAQSRFETLFDFLPDGADPDELFSGDHLFGSRLESFGSTFSEALQNRMADIRKNADFYEEDPEQTREKYDKLFDQLMSEDDICNPNDGTVREPSLKTLYAELKHDITNGYRQREIAAWTESIRTFVDESIKGSTRLQNFGLNALPLELRKEIDSKIDLYALNSYNEEVRKDLESKPGLAGAGKIPALSPEKVFGKEQLENAADLKQLIAEARQRGTAAYLVDANLFGKLVMQLGEKAQEKKYPVGHSSDLRQRGGKDRIGLWGWTRKWRFIFVQNKTDYPQVLEAQKEVQDFVRETIINQLVIEVMRDPNKKMEDLVEKLAKAILDGESLVRKEVNRLLFPVYKSVFLPSMKKAEDMFAAQYVKDFNVQPSLEERQQASAQIEVYFQKFQLGLHVGIMKYMAQNLALKIGAEQKDPTASVKLHYNAFLNTPVETLLEKGFFDKELLGDQALNSSRQFKDVVVKALLDNCSKMFKAVDVKASISEDVDLKDINDNEDE